MKDESTLRKLQSKLERALNTHRYEEADTALSELVAQDRANPRWPHKRGDVLRKLARHAAAVECYASAVDLYAHQGFIARAVAMAKTALSLDPSRIDILERVDPQFAQTLRSRTGRSQAAPAREATRAVTQDAPPPGEELASAPAVGAQRPPPLPVQPKAPATVGIPPPPTAASASALPLIPPASRVGTIDLARGAPRATSQRAASAPLPDFYACAPDSVRELSADPSAAPNETRFPNAPSYALELSDIEIEPRESVMDFDVPSYSPPTAARLAELPLFPLFAEVPKAVLAQMVAGSELIELEHGAYVMRKGDACDALYGIIEGGVEISVPGKAFRLTLAEGDVFGETSLLEDETRRVDAQVQGKLTALRVPREVLSNVLLQHPPLLELLLELLIRRLLSNLLQSSQLFQELDATGRASLARMFEIRRAPANTVLATVGKKMDGLYITLTGTLSLNQPDAPERTGRPGSMFGQSTLLTNAGSLVDVKTRQNLIVLRLPTSEFTRLVMQYPTMLARLAEMAGSDVVELMH